MIGSPHLPQGRGGDGVLGDGAEDRRYGAAQVLLHDLERLGVWERWHIVLHKCRSGTRLQGALVKDCSLCGGVR